MMNSLRSKLLLFLLVGNASCSEAPPDYRSLANEIGESGGTVPQSVKVAAGQMLRKCDVPVRGRYVYVQFERASGEAPFTLELAREQSENPQVRTCLLAQAKALGMDRELDLGEEPPAPPKR
jgi:hypothetical protein